MRGQTTCGAIAKVADAYKISRQHKVEIRPLGAIQLHQDEYRISETVVRIADAGGHLTATYVCRPSDRAWLSGKLGAAKLLARDGDLYLIVPVKVETPEPSATGFLGVDLGVANIATDSTGKRYSGAELRGIRYRRRRLREKLQSKGTRSAKRRLKRMRRNESRFGRDVNHCISKQLVAEAERTKSALVLEDLTHIRARVRASGPKQRAVLSSWSFGQLRSFVTYKAALAGVPVILVDPRNTSRECSECGNIDKRNRLNQATFKCRACGHKAHADINAALVIRSRAFLSRPDAAGSHLAASPFGVN